MASGLTSTNHLGVNLGFTKFLFVSPQEDDDGARVRLRLAGGRVAQGFYNDYDAVREHEAPPHETIHFLMACGSRPAEGLASARYVVQVCSKYRPRLEETEAEFRRRIGASADIVTLDGAIRVPQYTSAAMHAYAFAPARSRASGREIRNAIILPLRKTPEWWSMNPLDRHAFFYPSYNGHGDAMGHARAAEAGIASIYRQVYHHPDGYGIEGQFDFISYFECDDEHLATFDEIRRNLRDVRRNPEWGFVHEGPEWRGHRVLRW